MLTIKFLPARYGDCIWIQYGNDSSLNHILIDGGAGGTHKEIRNLIKMLPHEKRILELCVVTHIDRDHIEGIVKLLEVPHLPIMIREIWFNAYRHLQRMDEGIESLGAKHGEALTSLIKRHNIPWNKTHFNGKSIVLENGLKQIKLPGGMNLLLLSPSWEELEALEPKWEKELMKAGLIPGYGEEVAITEESDLETMGLSEYIPDIDKLAGESFVEDGAEANGSSIAFIAEYNSCRILFAGDAYPSRILSSLNRIQPHGRMRFDLVKLSHHGSHGNTSPELLAKIDCSRFVFSTNGSIFKHPAPQTVARVIKSNGTPKELIFNYRTPYNILWDKALLKKNHRYRTVYPDVSDDGYIEVRL